MRNYIKVDFKAEEVKLPGKANYEWAPGFHLYVFEGKLMRIMPFRASDVNLTFSTKDEADSWSMEAAKEWCDRNFPDWPIQRFEE